MGSRCVYNRSIYGTVHVATCTYVLSQVRALCHVGCMGTQHSHRVVVKKNTTTEDMNNNTEEKPREYRKQISGHLHKHAQQQINGIECM